MIRKHFISPLPCLGRGLCFCKVLCYSSPTYPDFQARWFTFPILYVLSPYSGRKYQRDAARG